VQFQIKINRWLLAVSALVFVALVAGPSVFAGEGPQDPVAARKAAGSANGLCPVMGRPVTVKGGSAEYRGERIAFCCPPCAAKFNADPTRYMAVLRADPVKYAYASKWPSPRDLTAAARAAGTANGLCPVMGNPVKKGKGSVMVGDQKIGFCCPGCIAKFKANTQGYMRAMRADPEAYAYARPGPTNAQMRQARESVGSVNGLCPVMGNLVKPGKGSVMVGGQKVAFCCPGCIAKFKANTASYMNKMRAEPAVYGYVPSATSAAGAPAGRPAGSMSRSSR